MRKILKLMKSEKGYVIKQNDETLMIIIDKKINGSDIYDKIYKDLSLKEKPEISIIPEGFELNGEKIKEKEDRLVFEQVKELFSKIDKAINDSIN